MRDSLPSMKLRHCAPGPFGAAVHSGRPRRAEPGPITRRPPACSVGIAQQAGELTLRRDPIYGYGGGAANTVYQPLTRFRRDLFRQLLRRLRDHTVLFRLMRLSNSGFWTSWPSCP